MVLAGLALGVAVLAAWPEPTTQIVRLPYGESQPKAPAPVQAERQQLTAAPKAPAASPAPAATPEPEAEPARVLAAVEPAPEGDTAEEAEWAGPAPVESETELADDYVQESPEELGAEPLPGADVTQAPPPVAG
jgi:hypothetical protein